MKTLCTVSEFTDEKRKKKKTYRVIYDGSDSLLTVRGESFRKETNGNRNPFTLRSVSESKRKQSKHVQSIVETVLTELFIKIPLLKKKKKKITQRLRNTQIIEIIDISILHVLQIPYLSG